MIVNVSARVENAKELKLLDSRFEKFLAIINPRSSITYQLDSIPIPKFLTQMIVR